MRCPGLLLNPAAPMRNIVRGLLLKGNTMETNVMTFLRKILSLSCVLLLSASAWGQAAKPEPVITHIPAGAMGFVVVNDLQSMTGKVDKFMD